MFLCFGTEGWGCSVVWLVMIVLFFIAAITRKQISEWIDTGFSLIGAAVLGEIAFIICLYIFSLKISFLIGLIGIFAGGFIGAMFLEDTE